MFLKPTLDRLDADTDEPPGDGEMIVVAFDPGRFMTSQEVSLLTRDKDQYFTLYQEIIDKTGMKVSISSTFYKQLFHAKVLFSAFPYLKLMFVYFL